jgi:hypothetical protein
MTLRKLGFAGRAIASMASVAAAVTAVALAPPAAAFTPSEDWVLQELRLTNQKWYGPGGEAWILSKGHGTCDAWRKGGVYPAEVDRVMADNPWWTMRNARLFVTLMTRGLCPEFYLPKIPPEDQIYN